MLLAIGRRALVHATLILLCASACNWLSLGKNALTYETIQRGEAANIAVRDSLAYVTLAEHGVAVIDANSGKTLATLPPPTGSSSVDDVAIAGSFLFVLDARPPGYLSVLSLRDPLHPVVATRATEVPVGPFSGVSAKDGWCMVSGGTSALTAWQYDSTGFLTGPIATADLGRGQPDVLASRGGAAFVSTHFWGPYFGLGVIAYDSSLRRLRTLAELALDGAGFTNGGTRPANFPIEMAESADTTLLVAFAHGVAMVDVARAEKPRLERVIDVSGPAVSVDVDERTAAIAVTGSRPAIALLDLSMREPRVVRRISLVPGTNPASVAFSPRRIVVAARAQGVLIFDR
jgi:hypothetical protein